MENRIEIPPQAQDATTNFPSKGFGKKKRTHKHRKIRRRLLIARLLSDDQLVEFEAFLRGPHSTVRAGQDWLLEQGHKVSHMAVWRYRLQFDDGLMEVRKTALLSVEYNRAARIAGIAGPISMSDTVVLHYLHLHVNKVLKIKQADELQPEQWIQLLATIGKAVGITLTSEASEGKQRQKRKSERVAKRKAKARVKKRQPKKSRAQIEADARAAGPGLVERMERILNL